MKGYELELLEETEKEICVRTDHEETAGYFARKGQFEEGSADAWIAKDQLEEEPLAKDIVHDLKNSDAIYVIMDSMTGMPFLGLCCDVRICMSEAHAEEWVKEAESDGLNGLTVQKVEKQKMDEFFYHVLYEQGAEEICVLDPPGADERLIVLPGTLFCEKPDYTGLPEIEIPVTNPEFVRATCYFLQKTRRGMACNVEGKEFALAFRNAQFLLPVKGLKNANKESVGNNTVILKEKTEFGIASILLEDDLHATPLFTDWSQFRSAYPDEELEGLLCPIEEMGDLWPPDEWIVFNISSLCLVYKKEELLELWQAVEADYQRWIQQEMEENAENPKEKQQKQKSIVTIAVVAVTILVGVCLLSSHMSHAPIRKKTFEEERQNAENLIKDIEKHREENWAIDILQDSFNIKSVGDSLEEQIGKEKGDFSIEQYRNVTFPLDDGKNKKSPVKEYWEYAIVYSPKANSDGCVYIGLAKFKTDSLAIYFMGKEAAEEKMTGEDVDESRWFWKCEGEIVDGAYYGKQSESGEYASFRGLKGYPGASGPVDLYFGFAPKGEYVRDGVCYNANDDNTFCFSVPAGEKVNLDVTPKGETI